MAPIIINLPYDIGMIDNQIRDYNILKKIKFLNNKDLLNDFLEIAFDTYFYFPFLHRAVENNDYDMVKFLLDSGEDPNQEEKEYYHLAIVYAKNTKMAQLLIDYGLDINNNNPYFKTLLQYFAIECEDMEMTKLLIYNGANYEPLMNDLLDDDTIPKYILKKCKKYIKNYFHHLKQKKLREFQ